MKSIRVFLAAAFIAISLGGCAQLQTFAGNVKAAYTAVTTAQVNNKAVYVSASAVDALVITATNYLNQPRCTGSNGPICRSPAATKAIAPALRSLIHARQALVQFAIDHPGALGAQGLQDAVQKAYAVLVTAMSKFNVA